MTPLWQQRRELAETNAQLVQQWMALLDSNGQLALLYSLVNNYTLPDLRKMNAHVKERLASAQEATR